MLLVAPLRKSVSKVNKAFNSLMDLCPKIFHINIALQALKIIIPLVSHTSNLKIVCELSV